ncbi:MAG: ABC transporter substrate-binding protein, partial [Alphaproteobacteria bacterium]|nr:ABC transporter substrate-binding protein [Alphaproteobacteria bacterium]
DEQKKKAIALALQERVAENPTHAFVGQWYQPAALRKNVTGNVESPVPVFWNVEKK